MADSTEIYDLIFRDVSEQSIAHTFKGIIRIAHIKELVTGQEDNFLSSIYYGTPKSLVDISGEGSSNGIGFASASAALAGNVERYASTDEYKNGKLPVTDSIGEYLNYNIGIDGVTFGSVPDNNSMSVENITTSGIGGTTTHPRFYPSLTTNFLHIGLDEFDSFKSGTKFFIESEGVANAKVAIANNTDQSASDDGHSYAKGASENLRTVYNITKEPENHSVLMYQQENYDKDNLVLGTHDANVNVVNFKDYIKERIQKIIDSDFIGVPTGSVIWQYVSVDKWLGGSYGSDSDGNVIYPGNNPDLGDNTTDTHSNSRIQGVCRKVNFLWGGANNELYETIPLYKRDYAPCDGKIYTIGLSTEASDFATKSMDRFFDLFYTIGYEYTEIGNMTTQRKYQVITDENGRKRMYFDLEGDGLLSCKTFINEENKRRVRDVAYAVDIATILAFKALRAATEGGVILTDGHFDREKAEEYLKTCPIDKRYPITTPFPFSSFRRAEILKNPDAWRVPFNKTILGDEEFEKIYNTYYNKTDDTFYKAFCSGGRYINPDDEEDIFNGQELGREITTFNDPILFYATDDGSPFIDPTEVQEGSTLEYKICRVWQLPSIQKILDLLEARSISKMLWGAFTYKFSVPNFNITARDGKPVGALIGFSHTLVDEGSTSSGGSSYTAGSMPHRHFVFKGETLYNPNSYPVHYYDAPTDYLEDRPDSMPAAGVCWKTKKEIESVSGSHVDSYNIAEIATEYYDANNPLELGMVAKNDSLKYYTDFSLRSKLSGSDVSKVIDANRCPTSPSIDCGYEEGITLKVDAHNLQTSISGDAFTPESCIMIPLIKL